MTKEIPAFPAMHFDLTEHEHGMTLRDYFAAKALPKLIGVYALEDGALRAYEWADAMLKAREQ